MLRRPARFILPQLIAVLLGTALLSTAHAQFGYFEGVCRMVRPEGFGQEYERAIQVLPSGTTADPAECKIFLTKKDTPEGTYIYAHSNFQPEGFEFPTKVTARNLDDLRLFTLNVLHSGSREPTYAEQERILRAHSTDVEFFFDQSLLNSSGDIPLDLHGPTKTFIVFGDPPVSRRAVRITPPRGPPQWVVEWSESLYVRATSGINPQRLLGELEWRQFDKSKVRFVSLFNDKAVEDAIKASTVTPYQRNLAEISETELRAVFSANAGSTILLLGHVEDGRFVTRSTDGQTTLLSTEISAIERMARSHGCDVVYLGCSAGVDSSVGARGEFNPVFAVRQIADALNARSYGEFLKTLSSPSLVILMDEGAFSQSTKTVSLSAYEKRTPADSIKEIDFSALNRVGVIGLLLASGIGQGDGNGSDGGGSSWTTTDGSGGDSGIDHESLLSVNTNSGEVEQASGGVQPAAHLEGSDEASEHGDDADGRTESERDQQIDHALNEYDTPSPSGLGSAIRDLTIVFTCIVVAMMVIGSFLGRRQR